MANVQKNMAPTYEKKPDGTVVRYRVIEEIIDVNKLQNEKIMLENRLQEINAILETGVK